MIKVSVDESEVKEMTREEIKRIVNQMETELVFWDTKELSKRTCMSFNFIKEQFFYDKDFPKFKVGSKWFFPANETKEFLLQWLKKSAMKY